MFLILSKRRREGKLKKKKKGATQDEQLAENSSDTYLFKIQVHVVERKKNTNSKLRLHSTNFNDRRKTGKNVLASKCGKKLLR